MTMTDIAMRHEETETKGRYTARVDPNGPVAELTYSRASPTLIIIDHTGVSDGLRGTGLGQSLVKRAVEDARAGGWKILPLCPFAAAQFRQHPDWADVLSR